MSTQNDKVRIGCPIMLASPNQLFQIDMLILLTLVILSIFKLENSIKGTMNYSSEFYRKVIQPKWQKLPLVQWFFPFGSIAPKSSNFITFLQWQSVMPKTKIQHIKHMACPRVSKISLNRSMTYMSKHVHLFSDW